MHAVAQAQHVAIYRRSYDLCLYLEQVVRAFPRYQKYSLGADLRDSARRALRLVVRANSRQDKAPILLELRETLEELKVLLRLGRDGKAFQRFNSFAHARALVVDVGKQNEKLTRRAGERTLVFCRVGRFVELRGRQRLLAERALGLEPARLRRGGFAFVAGFPAALAGVFAARALGQGLAVLDVGEAAPEPGRRCRRRLPRCLTVPASREAGAGHAARDTPFGTCAAAPANRPHDGRSISAAGPRASRSTW